MPKTFPQRKKNVNEQRRIVRVGYSLLWVLIDTVIRGEFHRSNSEDLDYQLVLQLSTLSNNYLLISDSASSYNVVEVTTVPFFWQKPIRTYVQFSEPHQELSWLLFTKVFVMITSVLPLILLDNKLYSINLAPHFFKWVNLFVGFCDASCCSSIFNPFHSKHYGSS